jgi:hypothetical protein
VTQVELELLKASLAAGVALITLLLTWFVSTRVTTTWNLRQKQRELALSSADQFYSLYGEFFAIWKLWDEHLRSSDGDTTGSSVRAKSHLLERALAAESGIEAMMLKLTGQQILSKDQLYALGSFRQGYQTLRERIKHGEPMGWNWDSQPEYAAYKFLASAVSQALVSWRPSEQPNAAEHYNNFRIVTANYWEQQWIQTAQAQGCKTISWRPKPTTDGSQRRNPWLG